jgi:thymidylate synthase
MKDILIEEYDLWKSLGIIIVESEGRILDGTYKQQEYLNQIEAVIWTYKNKGYRNNQLVMQVGIPDDLLLQDPACLRSIDTRIQNGKLHFFVYFRSWDLWSGFPANLAGIQNLKEYMAAEIGVEDGEMVVESKGLHLYGYAEDLAKLRCMRN